MNLRPAHLLVPLLGIALALLSPFERPELPIKKKKGRAAAVPQVGGKWSDARYLAGKVEEMEAWVVEATGMAFVEVPGVRVSTADDAAGFLREDLDAPLRTLGAADGAAAAAMARDLAGQLVAAYDPKENVIHVLPENAVAAAASAGDESLTGTDVLRLALIRMGVVALDRQLFPEWKAALDAAPDLDAVHAVGAVLEGHAQYVTERIAEHWVKTEEGFSAEAFPKLVTLLTAPPAADASQNAQALANEAKFAILQGHAFMKATARKRSFKKILRDPPTKRGEIFDPEKYLFRFTKAGRLPEQIAAEFAKLTPAEGGWGVEAAALPASDVEAFMQPLDRGIWSAELGAFQRGHRWTATTEDGVTTTTYLIEFRTGGMAESYVALARSAAEKRGLEVQAGAGRDASLVGFAARSKGDDDFLTMQLAAEGRYVVGFASSDAKPTRDAWDDALDAAAEVLAKLQKTRKNRRDK